MIFYQVHLNCRYSLPDLSLPVKRLTISCNNYLFRIGIPLHKPLLFSLFCL